MSDEAKDRATATSGSSRRLVRQGVVSGMPPDNEQVLKEFVLLDSGCYNKHGVVSDTPSYLMCISET